MEPCAIAVLLLLICWPAVCFWRLQKRFQLLNSNLDGLTFSFELLQIIGKETSEQGAHSLPEYHRELSLRCPFDAVNTQQVVFGLVPRLAFPEAVPPLPRLCRPGKQVVEALSQHVDAALLNGAEGQPERCIEAVPGVENGIKECRGRYGATFHS